MRRTEHDKPMPRIAFRVMATIMMIRGCFRNKKREVKDAGIRAGDVVLDFGCGLGFCTFPAADRVGQEGKVHALDIPIHRPSRLSVVRSGSEGLVM